MVIVLSKDYIDIPKWKKTAWDHDIQHVLYICNEIPITNTINQKIGHLYLINDRCINILSTDLPLV